MRFELLVALRYLREGRAQSWLILVGVGVGVGVIIFLSALITGLQGALIARTLGTQAQVVVRPPEEAPRVLAAAGDRPRRDAGVEETIRIASVQRPAQRVRSIVQWEQARDAIARLPGVTAVAPTVSGPAIAVRGDGSSSVAVRGIEPESYGAIVDLAPRLVAGRLDLASAHALVGAQLAHDLGLSVGDRLRLQAGTGAGAVYTVSGIFDLGSRDLNQRWVFVSLRTAQSMFGLEGGVSSLEVKTREVFDAESIARAIAARTGLVADSWMQTNAQLLLGLRSQSNSSLMIQAFVILAVALGIASVLAVSVVQKAREIGILKATGTRTGQVMRIFLIEGAILGLAGSVVGIALGAALALFFSHLARNPDGSPQFPVALGALLYARSAAIAVLVGLTAAVLPARRAARTDPAVVIRRG